MPFISVVIPVYNVERYLRRCVESLVNQGYESYEIILVDDGSTDNSGILCEEIAKEFANVTAVHKANGGLGSARNFGLDCVKGDYVTFVDSDDWVTHDYFQSIEKILKENHPDIVKFGYQKIQYGVEGVSVTPYFEEGYYKRQKIIAEILPGVIGPIRLFDYSKSALMSACSCVYSMNFLQKNRICFQSEREILNEDHLFNFSALLFAESVVITHKVLYLYDFREGSLSKRYISNMVERKQRLLQEYRKILLNSNLFEQYEEAYYTQCADSYYACITNECGHWNSKEKNRGSIKVKGILKDKQCQVALRKSRHNNLNIKGFIIYWLMRTKQARLMCIFYKFMKNQKEKGIYQYAKT